MLIVDLGRCHDTLKVVLVIGLLLHSARAGDVGRGYEESYCRSGSLAGSVWDPASFLSFILDHMQANIKKRVILVRRPATMLPIPVDHEFVLGSESAATFSQYCLNLLTWKLHIVA